MAAGLTMKKGKTEAFRKKINEIASKVLPSKPSPYMIYDTKLNLRNISMDLVEELEKLEPFGNSNPMPYFVMEDVYMARNRVTKDGQHLQLTLRKGGLLTSSIGFWMAQHSSMVLDPAQKFDALFMLQRNRQNYEQMVIKDLKEVELNW